MGLLLACCQNCIGAVSIIPKNNRCLYSYKPLENDADFHQKCSMIFFRTPTPPVIPYTIDQMYELAKSVLERSVAIPGVQPKLSMS